MRADLDNSKAQADEERTLMQNREYLCKMIGYTCKEPEKVVNELFDRYCNLSGIFGASTSELLKIKGMDEATAEIIKNFTDLCRAYMDDLNKPGVRIYSADSAYNAIKNKFVGLDREVILLLILNSRGQVIFNNIINEGNLNMVPVYIKDIVKICLDYKADTVVIAHNHPNGSPIPSKNDITATKEILLALESIYITLYDHLIIAKDDYVSMRNAGWLQDIARTTNEFRRTMIVAGEEPIGKVKR